VQFFFPHQPLQPLIRLAGGSAHLDPIRAAQRADISFGDDPVSRRCNRHKFLFDSDCSSRRLRSIPVGSRRQLQFNQRRRFARRWEQDFYFIFLTFNRKPLIPTTSTLSPLLIFSDSETGSAVQSSDSTWTCPPVSLMDDRAVPIFPT
jgi:hypothetical protein